MRQINASRVGRSALALISEETFEQVHRFISGTDVSFGAPEQLSREVANLVERLQTSSDTSGSSLVYVGNLDQTTETSFFKAVSGLPKENLIIVAGGVDGFLKNRLNDLLGLGFQRVFQAKDLHTFPEEVT